MRLTIEIISAVIIYIFSLRFETQTDEAFNNFFEFYLRELEVER